MDTDKIRYVLMFWYQPNGITKTKSLEPKEQTDGKRRLRQEHIRKLIDSLTDSSRTSNAPPQDEVKSQEGAPQAYVAPAQPGFTGQYGFGPQLELKPQLRAEVVYA